MCVCWGVEGCYDFLLTSVDAPAASAVVTLPQSPRSGIPYLLSTPYEAAAAAAAAAGSKTAQEEREVRINLGARAEAARNSSGSSSSEQGRDHRTSSGQRALLPSSCPSKVMRQRVAVDGGGGGKEKRDGRAGQWQGAAADNPQGWGAATAGFHRCCCCCCSPSERRRPSYSPTQPHNPASILDLDVNMPLLQDPPLFPPSRQKANVGEQPGQYGLLRHELLCFREGATW